MSQAVTKRRIGKKAKVFAALFATASATIVYGASPAWAFGSTLRPGEFLTNGQYLQNGHWELVLDANGYLIGVNLNVSPHCHAYSYGPAGSGAHAEFQAAGAPAAGHFVLKKSNGTIVDDFGGLGTGTNVSISSTGSFYVGSNAIHGHLPNCPA